MTHAELKALTDDEINRRIATEVMGWTLKDTDYYHAGRWYKRHGADWKPAIDDNDMRLVRDELGRRGLIVQFKYHLRWSIVREIDDEWKLWNATARQQAEAALLAVQKEPTT